jgi:hypothetical protein
MISISGGFVFSSGNIDISESFLLLPRVGDIEEEPFISGNVLEVQNLDFILRFYLDSESIGR